MHKQQKVQATVDTQLGKNFEAVWQNLKGRRGWFAYVRNASLLTKTEPRTWWLGDTIKKAVNFKKPNADEGK